MIRQLQQENRKIGNMHADNGHKWGDGKEYPKWKNPEVATQDCYLDIEKYKRYQLKAAREE